MSAKACGCLLARMLSYQGAEFGIAAEDEVHPGFRWTCPCFWGGRGVAWRRWACGEGGGWHGEGRGAHGFR